MRIFTSIAVKINLKNMKEIGRIVQYHRKYAGLSRLSLAEISGLGKTSIYDIENGKISVKMITLLKVLKVLNISLDLSSPIMDNYKGSTIEKS